MIESAFVEIGAIETEQLTPKFADKYGIAVRNEAAGQTVDLGSCRPNQRIKLLILMGIEFMNL